MSNERSDMQPGAAAWALAGVLGLLLLAAAIVAVFLSIAGSLREKAPRAPAPRAAPMLQVSERADRLRIEARQRTKGSIPVEEAMRRTAVAGWDAKP